MSISKKSKLDLNLRREKFRYIVIALNTILFMTAIPGLGSVYYLYTKYEANQLDSYLERSLEEFASFVENRGLGNIYSLGAVFIAAVFIIDLIVVIWLRKDLVFKLRDKSVDSLFGGMLAQNHKIVFKSIFYLMLTSFIAFGFASAFLISGALKQFLLIISFLLALFVLSGNLSKSLEFTDFEKKILTIYKILILLVPVLLLINIVYTFLSPFGVEKEISFQRHEFDRIANLSDDFSINEYGHNFHITHDPQVYKKNTTMSLDQKFYANEEIFVSVKNRGNTFGKSDTFLFFDEKMAELEYKKKFDKLFLYSKYDVEKKDSLYDTLSSHLEAGNLLGVDKYSFTTKDFVDEESLLYTGDYYKDSVDFLEGEFKAELNATGKFVFYTYLKDSLDLTITYQDLNEQVGRDDYLLQVEDFKGDVVKAKYIKDRETDLYKKYFHFFVKNADLNMMSTK